VRRLKGHRTYTTFELAELLDVGVTLISSWRKAGLSSIDETRPYLYAGDAVVSFLLARHTPRQPLLDGQIYCVACKRGCWPAGGIASVVERGPTTVDLEGRCPACGRRMFRRVRRTEIGVKAGFLVLHDKDRTAPLPGYGNTPQIVELEEVGS
jgi:hypothetical protein